MLGHRRTASETVLALSSVSWFRKKTKKALGGNFGENVIKSVKFVCSLQFFEIENYGRFENGYPKPSPQFSFADTGNPCSIYNFIVKFVDNI